VEMFEVPILLKCCSVWSIAVAVGTLRFAIE
jgi:hypothetical protein